MAIRTTSGRTVRRTARSDATDPVARAGGVVSTAGAGILGSGVDAGAEVTTRAGAGGGGTGAAGAGADAGGELAAARRLCAGSLTPERRAMAGFACRTSGDAGYSPDRRFRSDTACARSPSMWNRAKLDA